MQYLQWIIKGMAMGAADVVPGVSGGTLAFILGIYERLLAAISGINLTALRLFSRGQWRAFWQQIDGSFLCCLVGGILLSIFSLATLISWLLEYRPVPLWAFFNGLILAALPPLFKVVKWSLPRVGLFGIGILVALSMGLLTPVSFTPELWMFFVAGAVAICAMILPGISGSFILLIVGMYAPVILAVKELDIAILFLFASGCVVGILSFSRFLNWLLKHYHDASVAFLTGIVVGSVYKMWPWRDENVIYTPAGFAEKFGQHDLMLSVISFIAAVFVMLALLNLEKILGGSASPDKRTAASNKE